jgi:hypothetical protein
MSYIHTYIYVQEDEAEELVGDSLKYHDVEEDEV